ncbi:MAG: DNA repair protein RecO [Candidatus Cloacimonetes bacterium]|nr:DNA repair protein RecO [Candidatus Cloacimonadota bacterium]
MGRELQVNGIIIKKVKFRETSLILDVFTPRLGKINVIAKGVRKANSKDIGLFEILNELEFELYKNPQSEWYIYKTSSLTQAHLFNINYTCSILLQAAVEVIRQIIIPEDDSKAVYSLLTEYFKFTKQVNKNGIAIFWRFLLKLTKIIGIEINIIDCVICSKNKKFSAYFPQKHGFICEACYHPGFDDQIFKINKDSAEILRIMHSIGNSLNELSISKSTVKQLNQIFLIHLAEHFHKKIHLKSMELL